MDCHFANMPLPWYEPMGKKRITTYIYSYSPAYQHLKHSLGVKQVPPVHYYVDIINTGTQYINMYVLVHLTKTLCPLLLYIRIYFFFSSLVVIVLSNNIIAGLPFPTVTVIE